MNGAGFVFLLSALLLLAWLYGRELDKREPDDQRTAERWQRGEDALKRVSDRANAALWEREWR